MTDMPIPLSPEERTRFTRGRRNLIDALVCGGVALLLMAKFRELGVLLHLLALIPGYVGLFRLRRALPVGSVLLSLLMLLFWLPGVVVVVLGLILARVERVLIRGLPPEPVSAPAPVPVPKTAATPRAAPIRINLAVLPPAMTQLAVSRRLVIATLAVSVTTLLAFARAPGFEALRGWWPLLQLTGIILGAAALQKHHQGQPLHALLRVLLAPTLVVPLLNLPTLAYLWIRATLTLRQAAREHAIRQLTPHTLTSSSGAPS